MSDKPTKTTEVNSLVEAAIRAGGVLVSSPAHTLAQRLQERRITPEVIQAFGIEPRRDGWQYPTPGGGLRWKNASPKASPKYAWLDDKSEPAHALYYLDDLLLSVQSSGGACYLASGEPDLWALRSAGITNALCHFSENTVNPGLAEKLQSMGVLDLFIFPDLDKTGRAWAGKVAAAIEGSGIELHCKALPNDLGARGDLGLFWQRYTRKAQLFERDLLTLPGWIPTPEKKTEPKQSATYSAFFDGDIPEDYRQPIADALGVEKYNAAGWSNPVLCVFHDDHRPSAALGQAGLYCQTCGTTYNWNTLGDRLGLGTLADYYQAQAATVADVAPLVVGLTRESMQGLVAAGLSDFARVLYVLLSNGFDGGQVVTFKDIQSLCLIHGISERSGRNALLVTRGELPKNRKAKEQTKSVLQFFSFFYLQHITEKKSAKLKKLPKNEQAYRLPTQDEINQALDIVGGTYYLIPPEKLQSAKTFRAALYAAQIAINPGQYARKTLTQPLGITAPTSRAYDDIEGIEVIPNYKRTELTPDMIGAMPKTYHKLRLARKTKTGKDGQKIDGAKYAQIEATTADGATRLFSPCFESVARAYDFAGDGGKVEEVIRLANSYRPKE
jgi:hypothetical protein